jgi:hypothetical protein
LSISARQRQRHAGRSPNQPHQLVEEQQQAERAEHVIEMRAPVERPDRDHFQDHADNERGEKREDGAEHEAAGPFRKGGGEIGADHIKRAVRQVDEVHDAEDQRQPRRQEEQQHPKLDAVQKLLDEIQHDRC